MRPGGIRGRVCLQVRVWQFSCFPNKCVVQNAPDRQEGRHERPCLDDPSLGGPLDSAARKGLAPGSLDRGPNRVVGKAAPKCRGGVARKSGRTELEFGRASVQTALCDVAKTDFAVPSRSGPPAKPMGQIRSGLFNPASPHRKAPVAAMLLQIRALSGQIRSDSLATPPRYVGAVFAPSLFDLMRAPVQT